MSAKKNDIADFYRSERGRMVSYVRRLITDASDRDGEDIVQDVMLGLWDAADVSLPVEKLSAYIYRSLKNRVIDIMRSRKERLSSSAPVSGDGGGTIGDLLADTRYDTADEMEKREIRERLFGALDLLKKKEREIIVFTEFENKSFAECAEIFQEPVGTLLSRKSRALRKVRELLGGMNLYMEE